MTSTAPEKSEPLKLRFVLLALLIIGVLCGSICVVVWAYFRYSRPIGSGPAGPLISASSFSSPWTTRPVVLLGLGDNATHGLGTPSAHTYFQRLVINPPDEFADMRGICLSKVLPKLQQLNLAKSGTSSINCVDQQLPLLKPYSPDTFGIVVITIGNNDLIHDFGRTPPRDGALFGTKITNTSGLVKNFEKRLEAIHARINTTFPGGYQIYVANIPDLVDGEDDIERTGLPPWPEWQYLLASYNRTISLFAKHNPHVTWVDIRTGFLGHGIHCTHFWHPRYHEDDPHSWFLNDIEGPNHRGHDAIRRRFLLEMANELPDRLP